MAFNLLSPVPPLSLSLMVYPHQSTNNIWYFPLKKKGGKEERERGRDKEEGDGGKRRKEGGMEERDRKRGRERRKGRLGQISTPSFHIPHFKRGVVSSCLMPHS